jgi:multidrug resistance efflux pump
MKGARQRHHAPPPKPAAVGTKSVDPRAKTLAPHEAAPRRDVGRFARTAAKHLATLAFAAVALIIALAAWQYYVTSPWTRNGAVRVQVASIAPQVSGQIVELRVVDNQLVRQGDVLYVIEPFDFEVARDTAKAQLDQMAADLKVKQAQSERRQRLSAVATTPEEQQIFAGNALQAKAAYDAAGQRLAQAELNYTRTKVLSPVNGYVTNLLLRVGDFAVAGKSNISVIDSDSFWIDGYFEETKLAQICVGDRAEAQLLGYAQPIVGHVKTVTRGISVSNAEPGTQGLPNVNPIYTWVRLAQRVPVRIAIDEVPSGVPLVSGMTATVTIRQAPVEDHRNWLDRAGANVVDRLFALFDGPRPTAPDCLRGSFKKPPEHQSIPAATAPPTPSAEQIDPGLVPGINVSPRNSR